MTRSKVERMRLLDFPFWLIFIARVSHQAIPSYYGSWSSQWSVRGERCDVHFGVQSDIPILALESFFDLNHSTVLSPEGLLSGHCDELPQCPAWKAIERNPSRWTQPILRKLRCGKSKNRIMLYCCPEVKMADDTTRIVFPDELPPEENTENFAIPYNLHPNRHLLPGLNRSDCLSQPLEMPSTRIMGGKKAHLGQYPMVVRLAYKPIDREQERKEDLNKSRDLDDDGFSQQIDFRCGGVLLNDRYVLTAAHCLRDTTHRIYMVRLGELDERSNPDCELTLEEHVMTCADKFVDIPVIESIVHEKFDVPYRQNDIALLRLNTSIKPTDWIRPICLPFDWRPLLRHSPISADDPVLVGWGRDDSFQSSETLQQVRLNWYNTSECRSVYGNAYPKSISICESSQFCLGGGEESGRRADACQGDSGGPVLLTDTSSVSNRLAGGNHQREKVYAVGIISFGPWMCGNSYPSVYTSIPAYLNWILDNIAP